MSARYDFVGCNEDLNLPEGATGGLPVVDKMGVMAREELEEDTPVSVVFLCFLLAVCRMGVCRMGARVMEGVAIEMALAGS